MVTVEAPQLIGVGLYTPREAARFTKLRTGTFNRWFYGDAQGQPALKPRFDSTAEDRVVTFWDLIQALAVRRVRTSPMGKRISLQHIRDVVGECEGMGITSPFARRHTLYWFSDRLILRTDDSRTGGEQYIGLSAGVDKDQLYHGAIIRPYLEDVYYGSDKMARRWTALSSANYRVVLDSDRRFGMPIIEPDGVLVSALVDAIESEGSTQQAARAFDIKPEAIDLAIKYQEYLSPAA